ncbi:hypothetical protein GIB67_006617 [Kingdonia uniflora]|uniref:Large ribosomal subunit protein eL24-related N-terminal domain-containing protein n=1 Tax=Kingdonia uniflora TaxID=39325 RepID=A0A7J7LEI9_9MAGN|nr:hypothetical protein GIB67_006617 [Kingdonia uniflora]
MSGKAETNYEAPRLSEFEVLIELVLIVFCADRSNNWTLRLLTILFSYESAAWITQWSAIAKSLEVLSLRFQGNMFPIKSSVSQETRLGNGTELCRYSGPKIYPGKGIRFVRTDSQVFLFANSKCNRYFHNKLKPSKLTWTAMYRKQHKKVIQKRRTEKPEVRDAACESALREIKERIKKTKDEKKAKKAEVMA